MMITIYDYEQVLENAVKSDSTAEERTDLVRWCNDFAMNSWNGEYFSLERDKYNVFPIYKGVGEPDEDGEYVSYELIDAEIRTNR